MSKILNLIVVKNIVSVLFFIVAPFWSLCAQNEGNRFFRDTVHEIRFHFKQAAYWDSLVTNKPSETFMRCDVTIDGISFPDAGVRFKGNSSYNTPSNKKPFKIDLEEYIPNRKVDGQDQFSLNNGFKDPTFLREKLMLDYCQNMGIPAPRATFTRLYINDQFWGFYTVVEDISKTFLKQRFGNKTANLFKGDPRGTLQWRGWDASLYKKDYELKTNEEIDDWSRLVAFLNILNNAQGTKLTDSLPAYLNLNSWFSYWAVHNLFSNLDSYIGSGHNYYLYQNTTGKFEFITWDVNEAFGNFKLNLTQQQILNLPFDFIPQPPGSRPLMNRLISVNSYKLQLAKRGCELLQQFSNDKMDNRIDFLANLIRLHVYADPKKFYTNAQFEQNLTQEISTGGGGQPPFVIAGLKQFISARRAYLMSQLVSFGCTATNSAEIASQPSVDIFPNPSSGLVSVKSASFDIAKIRVFDFKGHLIAESRLDGSNSTVRMDLSRVNNGFYLVYVQSNNGSIFPAKLLISR